MLNIQYQLDANNIKLNTWANALSSLKVLALANTNSGCEIDASFNHLHALTLIEPIVVYTENYS